jgi:hypothetical protein
VIRVQFLPVLILSCVLLLPACGGGDSPASSGSAFKLPAVIGVAPPLATIAQSWAQYASPETGISLRYPPNWQKIERPDGSGVTLYPPDADPQQPSELISFQFEPARPYQPQASQAGNTDPKPITVSGVVGVYREDKALAIPTESFSIELPYRTGTLVISATEGPATNLVPQLREILKTAVLQP